MESFSIIFLTCVSVLFGMILTIFIQYCILLKYFKQSHGNNKINKSITSEIYCLPEALKKHMLDKDYNNEESKHCSIPISLLLQFLFHEMRNTDWIKRWLYKKLSLEFDELLTKTTTGKFFVAITIRDINLGSQFPDLKNITVENVVFDKVHGFIDTLDLCVQLDYSGNFLLSVDAKMKFGKTAYLSITVKRVSGLARLQFTRLPYTHWSFSFYNDPLIELGVESQFQGRQLQANITNLIIYQIKKAIKRKHTLPNYKIRYKPFFNKTDPSQLDVDDCDIIPCGLLNLSCIEVTRLCAKSDVVNSVYCTFTIDSLPWVRLTQSQNDGAIIILDITIVKNRQQQLGVVFKQESSESKIYVIVETIVPQSPAAKAGLCPGDILQSVDTKSVTTMAQVAKIIKSISAASFSIRIQRAARNYTFTSKQAENKTAETTDELEISDDNSVGKKPKLKSSDKLPKLLSNSNENVSKLAQTIGNFSLRKRKTSMEKGSGEGGKQSSSTPNTPQHLPRMSKSIEKTNDLDQLNECYQTPTFCFDSKIVFNCNHSFGLRNFDKYLNVNVWGQCQANEEQILLGYTNIPLAHILSECSNSLLGRYVNSYSFLPPDNTPPNNQTHPLLTHSGFEHCFCYGDILLSFDWLNDDGDDYINNKRQLSITTEATEKDESLKSQLSKHDFIRTQFHRTTHCDFCSKKIWLKDAVQCRNCALCCHKKCVLKCQTSTTCLCMDVNKSQEFTQPEITMTEICDEHLNELSEMELNKQYYTENTVKENGLKRVNSANSLAIPGSAVFANAQSRSLPPSPQHTPSRKQSLVNLNPFGLCPALLESCFTDATDPVVNENITQIIEQLLQCNQHDNLMDVAKETGIQFYSTIPHDQRTEKINHLMTELKKTLDTLTLEHMDLSKQLNSKENPTEKAKLAFLVGQADAKVHALSVLMLHYCSGLQQVQEKIV